MLMVPSIASPAIRYLALIVVLLTALQTFVLFEELLCLALLLWFARTVVYAVFFHLVVQIFVEFSQFFDPVGHAIPKILVGFWLFVSLAVDF